MADDQQAKIALLQALNQQIIHRHEALWEEEKHYTWWISIIFGALALVYANRDIVSLHKTVLITGGCLSGILMSLIGYAVIRKEGTYFYEDWHTWNRTASNIGLETTQPAREPNKRLSELLCGFAKGRLGIRDYFQVTMLLSAFAFVLFLVFTCLTLR